MFVPWKVVSQLFDIWKVCVICCVLELLPVKKLKRLKRSNKEPLKDIENDHYEELSEQLHIKGWMCIN